MNLLPRVCLLPVILVLQFGCASYAKYPVTGTLLDETIDTTVDSAEAQYYLNHYLQGERLDAELDRRIDLVYRDHPSPIPDRDDLRRVADGFSNDFAALFLADRLWQDQQNRKVQRIFNRYLGLSKRELFAPPSATEDLLVLLVPGWNYVDNGHVTGSDFAAPRRLIDRLGIDNELVMVPSNGSVQQSAEVIAERIVEQGADGRRIILVGASAAGPAIHYTLGKLLEPEQLAPVIAWVNLGGILQGSPLIDRFQQYPQKLLLDLVVAFRGWDIDEIMSMSAAQSRQRVKTLQLPQNLLVINYLGLSLTGSLSSLSAYKYPLIAGEGPNDGLTPLSDIIAPGSMTLVATRSDHYFGEDPLIDDKTIAMLKTILELIGDSSGP
ncbi:MAG TPA: hypothetical protein VIW27_13675 [Gammaproteobacteria bacterium]|jgi:hypothetical protein